MKNFCFWLALLSFLTMKSNANAHNTFFLPGDAFFHTVLTEDVLNQMEKEKSPVFEYARPEFLGESFCGYAGFAKLEFKNMPDSLKQQLRKLYGDLREITPKIVEITDEIIYKEGDLHDIEVKTGNKLTREINGFSVFLVNRNFDVTKHTLGLKYNEEWVDQVAAFGHDRRHLRLESFVQTPDAIAEEWRDSPLVPPLSAESPAMDRKNISEPVVISPDCKLLVLTHPDMRQLTKADKFDYIYEISETSTKRFIKRGKHWVRHEASGFGSDQ